MTNEEKPKIIQIIPAVGWYAIFDEGTKDEWKYPLVCWALTDEGEIVGQISTELLVEGAETDGNLTQYRHESEFKRQGEAT